MLPWEQERPPRAEDDCVRSIFFHEEVYALLDNFADRLEVRAQRVKHLEDEVDETVSRQFSPKQ